MAGARIQPGAPSRSRDRPAPRPRTPAPKEVGWRYELGMVTAGNLLLRLRGVLLLPLIAGALGAAAFGVWVQLLSVVTLGSALAELNLRTAAVRLLVGEQSPERRAERFWSIVAGSTALSVAGGAAMWLAAEPMALLLLRDASAAPVFRAGAFLIPGTTLNAVQLGLLRGIGEVRQYSVLNVIVHGGETLVALVLLLIWPALVPALLGMAAWRLGAAGFLVAGGVRRVGLARPRAAALREAMAFSVPTMPAVLAREMMDKADRFILGALMGAASVGVYSAAYSLAGVLLQFVHPIRLTLLPRMGAMWDRGEHDRAAETLRRVFRYFAAVAIPSVVGLAVVGAPVLRLLAGDRIAREGGPVVWIAAVGVMLFGLTMIVNQLFFAGRWTWALPVVFGTGAVLNVGLNFLLIPAYGLVGAAWSTVAAYAVALGMSCWLAARLAGWRPPLAGTARLLPAAAAMAAALALVPVRSWAAALAVVPAGAAVYAAGLYLLGGLLPKEKQWIRARVARPAAPEAP